MSATPHLTDAPIDLAALVESTLRDVDGAVALFAGAVRNHHEGRAVRSIVYEAYRPMAEKELVRIDREVRASCPTLGLTLVHRLGELHVGELSVAIVATSPHRADAFAACREAIERIKRTVPIWKKERGPLGDEWQGWQGGAPDVALNEHE